MSLQELQAMLGNIEAKIQAQLRPVKIIDMYSQNIIGDINLVKPHGVVGIIHKATQGISYVDPAYSWRRMLVTNAGLLWAAYHFCTGGDATAQVSHFLSIAQPDTKTLIAIDLERNPDPVGTTVTLPIAEAMVKYLHDSLGRWPVIYTSSGFINRWSVPVTSILHQCPLWIASYTNATHPTLPSGWSNWSLWQYGSGDIPGITGSDSNVFNGTLAELQTFWGK